MARQVGGLPANMTTQGPTSAGSNEQGSASKKKKGKQPAAESSNQKRRCISTACVACRRRKSKCDGALPSCAACASVYGTQCIYDPNSDHRRKGVYRDNVNSAKAKQATLQTLIDAIINSAEEDVIGIVSKIRNCDNLDSLGQDIVASGYDYAATGRDSTDDEISYLPQEGERDLAGKMGELRLENGSVRYIGGTSHLIYLSDPKEDMRSPSQQSDSIAGPITSWTRVTDDIGLMTHLMNMYFTFHYPYFTTLSKSLFWTDFMRGYFLGSPYCSPLLVNAMLALGCHFTNVAGAYATRGDSRTKGDHFFAEAKRLTLEDNSFGSPHIATVQALALMSVREAGCAREAAGWVYSGMSFRMAQDIGLNLELSAIDKARMSQEEVDARRITFWGCFFFDKCWSNYLGRLPQIPRASCNVPKFEVFPDEDAAMWIPLSDKGFDEEMKQPARTRAVARHLISLSEISSDLLLFFYHPNHLGRSTGKTSELKKLGDLHKKLEEWRKVLPKEFEPKEGQLPNVLLMHMFFHLQYIHLFRPFLKYSPKSSPLPSHISPRRICTANAGAISKLMRLYKKCWGLRQICNIAVYMVHSACTIHLLNLPDKTARRDLTHGIKHLEEIAEDWICARRTLSILSVLSRKWDCELPEEAVLILQRADEKYGHFNPSDVPSPRSSSGRAASEDLNMISGIKQERSPSLQSRLSHFSNASNSPASIDGRLEMDQMVPPQQQQQQMQTLQPAMPIPPGQLNFTPDMIDPWSQPLPHATVAPMYNPNMMQPDVMAHTMPTVDSPSSAKDRGLDNSQWLLTDSARWHRNFEGWDMSAYTSPTTTSPTTAPFMFSEDQTGDPSYMPTGIDGNLM